MGDMRSLLAFAAPHRSMLALSGALTLCESAAIKKTGGRASADAE